MWGGRGDFASLEQLFEATEILAMVLRRLTPGCHGGKGGQFACRRRVLQVNQDLCAPPVSHRIEIDRPSGDHV